MNEELKSTKNKRGWLVPYLLALDNMFFKRWSYWINSVMEDKITEEPIPYIHFRAPYCYTKKQVQQNLKKCIDYAHNYSSRPLEDFIDWILWGLSYREALEYILKNDKDEIIKVCASNSPGKDNIAILPPEDRKRLIYAWEPSEAKYFLSNYRCHEGEYPYKEEFYSLKIGETKFMVVYKLRE